MTYFISRVDFTSNPLKPIASARCSSAQVDYPEAKEKPRFVAGSIGPTTKLPWLGHIRFDALANGLEKIRHVFLLRWLLGQLACRSGLPTGNHRERTAALYAKRRLTLGGRR